MIFILFTIKKKIIFYSALIVENFSVYAEYADMWLKKHFWLLSMLKTVVLLHIGVETMILWWTESSKEQHFFVI